MNQKYIYEIYIYMNLIDFLDKHVLVTQTEISQLNFLTEILLIRRKLYPINQSLIWRRRHYR